MDPGGPMHASVLVKVYQSCKKNMATENGCLDTKFLGTHCRVPGSASEKYLHFFSAKAWCEGNAYQWGIFVIVKAQVKMVY